MIDAVFDYPAIAKRLKPRSEQPAQKQPEERRSECAAIHPGCDWPDCPCGAT